MRADRREILFDENPFYWMIGVSSIVVLIYVGLFLHEWGHWLMARLGGYRILGMSIGNGRLFRRFYTRLGIIDFRWAPIEGFVLAVKDRGRESRGEALLLSAGGPLFTALYVGILLCLYQLLPFFFLSEAHNRLAGQIIAITLVLEVISLLYSLWPHGTLTGASDGLSIKKIIKDDYPKENFYQESLRDIRRVNEKDTANSHEPIPENEACREAMVYYLQCSSFEAWKRGFDRLDQTLEQEVMGSEEKELLLLSLADIALLSRHPDALERAGRHAEAFLESEGDHDFLRSRVGALQIEQGMYLYGKLTLRPLARTSPYASVRAFALSYLALCAFRQYGREEAVDLLTLARSLDPTSPTLVRIKHEVFGGSRDSLKWSKDSL